MSKFILEIEKNRKPRNFNLLFYSRLISINHFYFTYEISLSFGLLLNVIERDNKTNQKKIDKN